MTNSKHEADVAVRRMRSAQGRADLLELPSPFPGEPGTVRLLEPAFSQADALVEQLLSGEYRKPFVLEHEGMCALYFGSLRFQQSAMQTAAPHALEVAYTQGMMAFLLFNPRPRAMTLLGLGGGSLAKFCYRHLPATSITVLELDPDVIAFRDVFKVPQDDSRFRVECADAVDHVGAGVERCDVLMVDLFDEDGVAGALTRSGFYQDARAMLSGSGVMVMNIAGDKASYAPHVALVREAFDDNVIAMSVREDGNYLLFAFRNAAFESRWKWMKSIARELQGRMGLDFPRFAQLLERGQAMRLAQRMSC